MGIPLRHDSGEYRTEDHPALLALSCPVTQEGVMRTGKQIRGEWGGDDKKKPRTKRRIAGPHGQYKAKASKAGLP